MSHQLKTERRQEAQLDSQLMESRPEELKRQLSNFANKINNAVIRSP